MKLKHLLLLLMTVVSFSTTRAADGSDFTFNDGVRYSQWVINSRLNSFSANTAKMGFATFKADGTQISERNDGGKKKLDYVPGLVAKGVIEATQYYSQFTWAAPWTKPWFLSVADYGDKWYNVSTAGGSLDDLNGVKLYFALRELAKTDGVYPKSDTYDNAGTAIGKAITGLGNHNTYYSIKAGSLAGDDVVGGWFHKEKYNNQMWLDGQYMGPALLAQIINYKNATNNVGTDDWKLIIKQLDAVWNMCWNNTDKLLYHGFEAYGGTGTDDNATKSLAGTWAGLNASTLHSESYWGRACGWYFLALVDILHEMDKANLSTNDTYKADYTRIKGYLDELAAGLKARQDATGENATYGWYQILDKNGTYHASVYNNGQTHTDTYNYIESSATAIFAAAYIKAIRLGYLSESTYGETARNAYKCLVNNFFAADGNDGVHIFGSCRSAGLGSDKTDGTGVAGETNFRDGSNAYYLLGSDVAKVEKSEKVTEGKVLGAFILAATEYEQLYQTDKLLFEKDLAPTYTLKSDKPSITLNAYGVDGVTYQWYKDGGGAVTDATSATFTPTESGKYYCTATANGKTITSSTTDVTVTATDGVDNNTGDVKFSLSNITAKSGTVNPNTDYTIPSTGASITGGSVSVHNGKSSGVEMVANNAINISGSGSSYLCVTLYNNLAVGDVITLDKSGTMYVGNSTTKPGSSKTLPYTITEGDGLAGQNKLYLWKDGISSIKSLTITTASTTCTVTTSATNGSIAVVDGSGNTVTNLSSVAKGTKLVFTATPDDGYEFVSWTVDGTTVTGNPYTIESLSANTSVTANFKATQKSSDTNTTFGNGSLNGTTLTVDSYASTEAGSSQTINVTLPAGATATVTSGNATFADGVLTYTALAAGQSMAIKLLVTAEAGNTAEYTINVSTKSAGGSGTPSTATISWLDMALNSHNATTIAGIVTPEQFSSCLTGNKGITSGLATNGNKSINNIKYYRYNGFSSTEDTNIYFEYSYVVAGAKFIPTKLTVDWASSGSKGGGFKVYGVNSDNTMIALTADKIQSGGDNVYNTDVIDISGATESLKAIRIVPFGSGANFILNNVVLEGTVEVNGLNFDKGTLTDRALTVIHEPADAGQNCTIGIIPTDGVTCTLGELPAGVTASLSADGKTLTYNAPAAGTGFISIPLIATTADHNSYEYTVLVGTRVAPSYTSQYDNNKAWTPAVGGTIALSKLINYEGDDVHVATISSGDAATLSADGKTLTAVKTGEISLSLPATDNYSAASMKIQVNIGTDVAKNGTNAYTIESDKVYSDGLAVNRENITMTFGNDGFWAKGTTFSAGQKNPTPNSGKIPTSGTYYKFTPAKNGTLTAEVYIGKTDDGKLRPLYVSENGTAIAATAGEFAVGKGETPAATEAYQGDVTFNVKANTDYYVYVNGSKMRFYGFTFVSVASSDNTATFSRGVLNGETLTVTHPESEASSPQTITVTPAIDATCTSVSGPATLSGNTLSYTAPGAGASLADITLTVTAENGATKTYTINVSTVGDVTTGNAIFSVSELDKFGVFTGQKREIEKQSVTLTAVDGSEGNVQGQENGSGAKVQKTAGFTITPNPGYLITKVTLVTSQNNRHFDATPAQAGDIVQDDKTYEYSFNRIGDPITFSNNSGNGIYVTRIIVEYEKSVGTGKTILAASFDKNELTFYEDDTEIPALPVLSVKIGDEVADAGLYTVTYTSSNPKVVTVATNGKLTKVGAGSAVINAEIMPNDGNTYAGSEAYYTVTVTSLEEPVVTAHDLTVYNTAGVQPQPVIEVFATDNGTPVRISNYYYTLQFTEIEDNDDIINNDAGGKFILNGESGDWKVGTTATMKVTVIPTEEAKQRFHIKETVAEFKVTVVETGDMLLPYFGGVENGKMQKSALVNARTFITPVLYGGVEISEGFTFDCSFVDAVGSTTVATPAARLKSGTKKVTSFTGSKEANVTIYSGNSAETVYIHVVAKPNNDYKTQYKQIEKWISVDIGEYKRFLDVSIEPTKQTVPVGTMLDQLNDFTVTVRDEDGKTLSYEDGEYTMVWQSSSPGVASVDRGEVAMYATGRKVRALSGGVADIKVIVSKGGYSDMGAVCTLTVTDEGMFKVNGNTTYSKGTQFTVDGLTLSLGGWMFSSMSDLTESPWQKYGTTSEKPGKDTAWGSPTTANKKPLGFTHNIQMTNMKNARQEYGSNCMPESRNIYNPKLVEQKFVLMDPMFNVPCAGAYFALSPMTCGTVTVYVRQNGIFEHSSGDYAYRPQRRVFVMDEQGHLVSSTPKLEYPTNWDMGNDGTVFTCDILDKTVKEKSLYELAGADPTKVDGVVPEAERQKVRNYVQDRLIGLKNFSIQNFKNGVYASNIVDTTFHNAAYENHKDTSYELAARGWSVLSVAPVSYTFYVKPGKTYYIYNFGSKLGLYGFTFRKDNVTEDEFNWTDTKDVTPEPTAERHVAKVNIDRTFKAGVWAACVLPFSMTRQQVNAVFGDCFDNQEGHENGTQILYFDRVEGHKIYFRRHAYNTLVAGKPFLIKPAKEAVISSANMGDYPYVTIEAPTPQAEWGRTAGNTVGIGSIDTDYTWVSSYGSMTALPGDYYLNGNGDVSHCTEGYQIPIKGFRGYLKAKTKQAASKVLQLAYDSNVDGDGEATPIEGLVMDSEGNFLEVPTSGVVYNLSGQVVTRDADKLYTLPAGIYIVNGKKYIVR